MIVLHGIKIVRFVQAFEWLHAAVVVVLLQGRYVPRVIKTSWPIDILSSFMKESHVGCNECCGTDIRHFLYLARMLN